MKKATSVVHKWLCSDGKELLAHGLRLAANRLERK